MKTMTDEITPPEATEALQRLYSGECDEAGLDADIRYFEEKIAKWKRRYEGHTDTDEFKRLVMKTESQLALLKETRKVFFVRRAEIMEDQDDGDAE